MIVLITQYKTDLDDDVTIHRISHEIIVQNIWILGLQQTFNIHSDLDSKLHHSDLLTCIFCGGTAASSHGNLYLWPPVVF